MVVNVGLDVDLSAMATLNHQAHHDLSVQPPAAFGVLDDAGTSSPVTRLSRAGGSLLDNRDDGSREQP
jgi:hypothetical protein